MWHLPFNRSYLVILLYLLTKYFQFLFQQLKNKCAFMSDLEYSNLKSRKVQKIAINRKMENMVYALLSSYVNRHQDI